MQSRLYEVVERLLTHETSKIDTVDDILDCIDIEHTCNRFDDLVELVELCDKHGNGHLYSLGWFKKRLVDKIHKERGEEGGGLIKRIMKYDN